MVLHLGCNPISSGVGGNVLALGCSYPPLDFRGCLSAQHHMDLLMNFVSVLTSMMSINLKPCFWSAPVQVQRLACVCKSWKVYTTSVHSLVGAVVAACVAGLPHLPPLAAGLLVDLELTLPGLVPHLNF